MSFRRVSAVFLTAMMTFSCTAYGAGLASISSANPNAITPVVEVTEEEVPARVITYNEAVEMAIKNNSSLRTLEDNLEKLQETEEDLGMALSMVGMPGVPGMPTGHTYYIDSATATILTSLNTVQNSINTVEDSKEITEAACELTVKNYMNAIISGENNYAMMMDNLEISRATTYFNRIKYDLGMISLTEFNKALNDNKNVEYTVKLTKLALDTAYNNLGNIIGLNDGQKFVIDYSVVYEEYPEQMNLNTFANKLADASPTLKIADRKVDDAEFNKKVVAVDNGTSLEERNRNLEAAGREYNDTRNGLLLAVRNGYITVKQAEANIETLKLTLADTQKQYDNAVISHSLGYITDVELAGAKLGLTKAENDVETAIMNHDLAKFMLDHPYLSASSSTAQKQQ